MSIDWNWFFSSFSQSAAALIGIIGAFIISRLLGLSEKISSTISQFDNLMIEFNKILASISKRHFYWYTKINVRYNSDLKEKICKGEFENKSKEEILKRIYEEDRRLYKVDDAVMEAFNELYEANRPIHSETKSGGGLILTNIRPIGLDIPPNGIWDNLNDEKDAINELEVESRKLIQQFEQNLQDLHSFGDTIRPLRIIIIFLMVSFPVTVIYPLHFMPVATNQAPALTFNLIQIMQMLFTLKSLLLLIFFISIDGIFYYFLTLITQFDNKLNQAIQNNSDTFRDIKTYSMYFQEI